MDSVFLQLEFEWLLTLVVALTSTETFKKGFHV